MATVNKKPGARKKPVAKKAVVKKAAAAKPAEVELAPAIESGQDVPEAPVTMSMVIDVVNKSIATATKEIIQAVTAPSPQTMPDTAPGIGGKPDPNMMTFYPPGVEVEGEDVDLDMLDLTDPIGAQVARSGPRVIEAAALETNPLTKEQIDGMTEEQIAAYNQNELRKMQARKQQQLVNRSELEKMSKSDRIRALTAERDPSRIREADNPLGERMIQCIAVRRIGLGEEGTSDVDETIRVPLSGARILQDSGAIKVTL